MGTHMLWHWIVRGKVEESFLSFYHEISVPWNLNMIIWFGIRYFYWLAITLFPVAFIFPWMSSELCKLLAAILNMSQQTMHVAVLVHERLAQLGLWDITAASSKIIIQKRTLLTAASFWETFPRAVARLDLSVCIHICIQIYILLLHISNVISI